jgi:peroxiredoxin
MEGSTSGQAAWQRWLRNTWVRNALGLLVLAGIAGGLIAIDRSGGGAEGALDDRAPGIDKAAPEFALRDTDGDLIELSDYRGQPVWLNFWATWCDPCRDELPDIQKLADEFAGEDLVVLAINQEESAGQALDFWEELGLELPTLLDSDGDVSEQYRLFGLPDNFFIDRGGILRAYKLGFLEEEEMRENLAEIGVE